MQANRSAWLGVWNKGPIQVIHIRCQRWSVVMRNDKYAHLTCKLAAAIYQVEATLEHKSHNCALEKSPPPCSPHLPKRSCISTYRTKEMWHILLLPPYNNLKYLMTVSFFKPFSTTAYFSAGSCRLLHSPVSGSDWWAARKPGFSSVQYQAFAWRTYQEDKCRLHSLHYFKLRGHLQPINSI